MATDWETLRKLWRATSGPRSEFLGNTEAALVLADGLAEHGFVKLGRDLSKAARDYGEYWNRWAPGSRYGLGVAPRISAKAIIRRVEEALTEIRNKPRIWSGLRKTQAVIRYHHAISPSVSDVEGPFPATEADFVDLDSIRAWYHKTQRGKLGRIRTWRKEKGRIVLFPGGRSIWNAISIEPGRPQLSIQAREIQEMTDLLRRARYLHPAMYARRLSRAGINKAKLESELRVMTYFGRAPAGYPSVPTLDEKYNLRRFADARDQLPRSHG